MKQYLCVVCQQLTSIDDDEEELWLAGHPVCAGCDSKLRNRPYPGWLKLALAALVGLAFFSFGWNWRFMAALRELNQMRRALLASDFDKAADLAESAARHVPKDTALAGIAKFNRGLAFLSKGQSSEAVNYLRKARQSAGDAKVDLIDRTLLQAEAGAAFDAKNYDEFLAKSKALVAQTPDDAQSVAMVASAYACKYAVTGAEEHHREALKNVDKASQLSPSNEPQLAEYRHRILYRLDTREIISRDEFKRRFPNGYQPKAKP
jgi:tetratricopeptide (TPR) repeat protein